MTKLIVLLLASAFMCAYGRHIQHHEDVHTMPQNVEIWKIELDDVEKDAEINEVADVEILKEVPRHIKSNRFMPLNNALFFMGPKPCPEEGYKRDYLGICREVWD